MTQPFADKLVARQYGDGFGNYEGDGFWYSDAGYATRYGITAGIVGLILLYFVGGYLHGRSRRNKGKQPLAYHRWMFRSANAYYAQRGGRPGHGNPYGYGDNAYNMPYYPSAGQAAYGRGTAGMRGGNPNDPGVYRPAEGGPGEVPPAYTHVDMPPAYVPPPYGKGQTFASEAPVGAEEQGSSGEVRRPEGAWRPEQGQQRDVGRYA